MGGWYFELLFCTNYKEICLLVCFFFLCMTSFSNYRPNSPFLVYQWSVIEASLGILYKKYHDVIEERVLFTYNVFGINTSADYFQTNFIFLLNYHILSEKKKRMWGGFNLKNLNKWQFFLIYNFLSLNTTSKGQKSISYVG